MNNILTVSALTEQLRRNLEGRFPFVWVRGEVTNLSRPVSGHIYFTLKDARAQLQCVWFAGRQGGGGKFDPLTGEVYASPRPDPTALIRNGIELLCAGPLGIYAPRGQYQLLVEFVEAGGAGALAQAFEERKARLAALGYFAQERKRPLPANARRIALITSDRGAAIHDFLELAASRGLPASIRVFPVPVQGCEAPAAIAGALTLANSQGWAQVAVIVRGGGSLEDLWAFNDENLAETIFNSRIPVLAGIGHEIDFTLADLTADVRAATPSHAAQLLWPLRRELMQAVDDLDIRLARAMKNIIGLASERLAQKSSSLALLSPCGRLRRLKEKNEELSSRLHKNVSVWLRQKLEILDRGNEALLRAPGFARMLAMHEQKLAWLEQILPQTVKRILSAAESGVSALAERAWMLLLQQLGTRQARLDILTQKLEAVDPAAPLRRGYALLYGKDGLLRSVDGIERGQTIEAQLVDGRIVANVEAIKQTGRGHDDK